MNSKLAKLTVGGRLPKAREAMGRWLWLCRPLVLDTEECGFGGFSHTHLTIAIPRDFANEAAQALVKWANDDTGGCRLLFYDGELELPWPDETNPSSRA